MDPISAVLIKQSLDGLSARARATAENIANSNSPGFRPLTVSFENSLQAALSGGTAALRRVTPRIDRAPAGAGGEMRLDLELATASETAMRYAALIDLLGRQMQISRTVIKGGQ